MAHVEKYTDGEVLLVLRHNSRSTGIQSNPDVDPERSRKNYDLAPERRMDPYAYYRKRKRQLYCYGRRDVKTMAGFVVTLPKEIKNPEEQKEFFKAVYDFMEERYGKENVIQASVHYDEGVREPVIDRKTGDPVLKPDGTPEMRFVAGQPHLHFCWIPVVKVDQSKLIRTNADGEFYKTHSEMSLYDEKICAKEVITRQELRMFHRELQLHLNNSGINGKVLNGATVGKGLTVEQLKEKTKMEMKIARLEQKVKALKREQEVINEVVR